MATVSINLIAFKNSHNNSLYNNNVTQLFNAFMRIRMKLGLNYRKFAITIVPVHVFSRIVIIAVLLWQNVCMCVSVCMYVHMLVCMCVFKFHLCLLYVFACIRECVCVCVCVPRHFSREKRQATGGTDC